MKEKFLQFFTGKLSKSIYIAVASAVVCGAVVIGSAVAVHNHNQEIRTENTASESVTETVTESATEDVSITEWNDTTAPAQAANNEPAGDRALEYLAEYNRITEEYERKRAELGKETAMSAGASSNDLHEPQSRAQIEGEAAEEYATYLKDYEKKLLEYEESSREAEEKAAEERGRVEKVQQQIDALDAQYEKDIAALKAQYGIA